MNGSAIFCALVVLCGCTRRATDIQVRDPGLVSVSTGSPMGWQPVLPPDGRVTIARLAEDANVVRAGRKLSVSWPAEQRTRDLIDDQGRLARVKSSADIRAQGGLFYVPYAVHPRGVYAYEELARRPEARTVLLATPTYNLDHARYEEGPHQWPAYVMIPIGAVLSAAGIAVMASADGQYEGLERLGGGLLLVSGAPLLGVGIYVAASSPTIVPLAPGVSTGAE
jgi:hypothetical protein